MTPERIAELRAVIADESLSYDDIADIEGEFDKVPDSQLGEPRENAMAEDMLNEIEAMVPGTERTLRSYIVTYDIPVYVTVTAWDEETAKGIARDYWDEQRAFEHMEQGLGPTDWYVGIPYDDEDVSENLAEA